MISYKDFKDVVDLIDLRRLSSNTASATEMSGYLKDLVCDFQLDFANFSFAASQQHKRFKECSDDEGKKELKSELDDLINSALKLASKYLADGLQDYFSKTRESCDLPRVGIHAIDHDGIITPLYITGKDASTSSLKNKAYSDYTPFLDIKENTGIFYLSQNIPRDIRKRNDYKHAGINLEQVRKAPELRAPGYMLKNAMLVSRFYRGKKSSRDEVWRSISGISYKSHLIVPITFRGHAGKLNDSLVKILSIREDGRSILGFIAVDHFSTYYFDKVKTIRNKMNKNIDVNVAYIFADMLSLYRIVEFMYTTGSKSYNYFKNKMES